MKKERVRERMSLNETLYLIIKKFSFILIKFLEKKKKTNKKQQEHV